MFFYIWYYSSVNPLSCFVLIFYEYCVLYYIIPFKNGEEKKNTFLCFFNYNESFQCLKHSKIVEFFCFRVYKNYSKNQI